MDNILISGLVLNGSRSGYRRILRNLVLAKISEKPVNGSLKFIFVFQRSGWLSLGIDIPENFDENCCKLIIIPDFKSKWARGGFEQFLIPWLALKNNAKRIFMPATFGLVFSIVPVITFVHTNTSFSVDKKLRGRSSAQQKVHNILAKITSRTSRKLLFTTSQTHEEFCKFSGKAFPKLILGNGLIPTPSNIDSSAVSNNLINKKYILSVSQFYRLKNFDSLIRAFIKLKQNDKFEEFKLVIVGSIQEIDYYEELQLLKKDRTDIIFLHNLSDEHLNILYINAACYCFYSYFEGYSLTPAEAMLFNIPVAISDISTHREIYENSVIYADPHNIDSIENSIEKVLSLKNIDYKKDAESIIEKFDFSSFLRRLENEIKQS